MNSFARIRMAACLLGGFLLVQGGLLAHMMLGPKNVYQPVRKPFSSLPNQLNVTKLVKTDGGDKVETILWSYDVSPDQARIPAEIPFTPIDLSYRIAHCRSLGLTARCYIVQSEKGEDRKHHPEICIRDVLKIPEVKDGQKVVLLANDKDRPVQRYVFQQGHGPMTAVYYWYYEFKPVEQTNQSGLQSLYHSFSRMPPSVTVEVTVTAPKEQWPTIESDLLAPLDKILRDECLPTGVKMGCARLPIALVTK